MRAIAQLVSVKRERPTSEDLEEQGVTLPSQASNDDSKRPPDDKSSPPSRPPKQSQVQPATAVATTPADSKQPAKPSAVVVTPPSQADRRDGTVPPKVTPVAPASAQRTPVEAPAVPPLVMTPVVQQKQRSSPSLDTAKQPRAHVTGTIANGSTTNGISVNVNNNNNNNSDGFDSRGGANRVKSIDASSATGVGPVRVGLAPSSSPTYPDRVLSGGTSTPDRCLLPSIKPRGAVITTAPHGPESSPPLGPRRFDMALTALAGRPSQPAVKTIGSSPAKVVHTMAVTQKRQELDGDIMPVFGRR